MTKSGRTSDCSTGYGRYLKGSHEVDKFSKRFTTICSHLGNFENLCQFSSLERNQPALFATFVTPKRCCWNISFSKCSRVSNWPGSKHNYESFTEYITTRLENTHVQARLSSWLNRLKYVNRTHQGNRSEPTHIIGTPIDASKVFSKTTTNVFPLQGFIRGKHTHLSFGLHHVRINCFDGPATCYVSPTAVSNNESTRKYTILSSQTKMHTLLSSRQ